MTRRRIFVSDIKTTICARFDLAAGDMTSPDRMRRIARPRQVAMYLARKHTRRSLPQIGDAFGGRHHTTVLHAVRQIARLRRADEELRADIAAIEAELGVRR